MTLTKHNYRSTKGQFFFFLFLFFCTLINSYGQQTGCLNDFDCDGIIDVLDVDDDNDGLYDHIESPTCFYLDKTIYEKGDRRSTIEVSTTLNYISGTTDLLVDGISIETNGISVPGYAPFKDREIIRLTSKLAAGIQYSAITFHFSRAEFFYDAKVAMEGSQDGITWTNLTEMVPGSDKVVTIPVTKNLGYYKIYRLVGMRGMTKYNTLINEVTGTIAQYMPSLYPKPICDGEDVDGDGKSNHQDLDSDGDSCNDVIEAGFLDPDNDGILGSSPVKVDDWGRIIAAVGYKTPNNLYFLDSSKNVCTNEGISGDEDSHCKDTDKNITNDFGLAQSLFHASMMRTKTGFVAFGEHTSATGTHLTTPTDLIPGNGYNYDGTIITVTLGGAAGENKPNQFFILSTEGLYTWANITGACIPNSWTTSKSFQKIDLPADITPEMIKYISASFGSLILLTKFGDVYVAGNVPSAYGDGNTVKDNLWHKSNVSHIVSVKMNGYGQGMALKVTGAVYTWGSGIVLGDGTDYRDVNLPTKMTLPATITSIKMIAMTLSDTSPVYYVLGNDKRVYSLGGNSQGQLGINSITKQLNWQTVKNATGSGHLENIKFINASIHDNYSGAAGAITEKGLLYLWGKNDQSRLGTTAEFVLLPRIPDGISERANKIMYVELGGHVTPAIDKKLGKFGYVGHQIYGSMGIPTENEVITSYDFINTPLIDFCNLIMGGRKRTRIMINPMNINSKSDQKQ